MNTVTATLKVLGNRIKSKRRTGRVRGYWGLVLATGFLLLAVATAFWPVTNTDGTDCGNWISANDSAAAYADITNRWGNEVADCERARDGQTGAVVFFGVAGVVCLGGGLVRRYPPTKPSESRG